MKISTRGRYGLRAMYELALEFGEGPLRMSTIAERQALSRKHLHTLLTSLKDAGLVDSTRGPGGGFQLTRPPARIRLSEILDALEGPLSLVHCVSDERSCARSNGCAARGIWQRLSDAIQDVLHGVTLQNLVASDDEACEGRDGRKRSRGSGGRRGKSALRSRGNKSGRRIKAGKK